MILQHHNIGSLYGNIFLLGSIPLRHTTINDAIPDAGFSSVFPASSSGKMWGRILKLQPRGAT